MFMLYVAAFLATFAIVSTPKYPWKDAETGEAVFCDKCPPGMYVGMHFSRHIPTRCLPCGDSQYTEFLNYIEECLVCDYACSEVQEEVHACNATHNRVFRCKEGYFSTFDFCLRHTVCQTGEGVQTADIKVCNQEMVRFVLGRLHSDRQTQKLMRAGSAGLELSALLDVLVGKKSPSGLEVLLDALDRARLQHLHRLVSKWFSAQGSV